MSEEIKEMIIQLKEILNKYPDKQLEILQYVFGRNNLMKIINEPTYEQLQQENQQLKIQVSAREEVANLYKSVIYEARKHIEWFQQDNREFYKNKGIGLTLPEVDGLLNILDKVNIKKNENE